ncbi:S-layer homology domain-containing protein [Agathobaculum butyriciproducens]|nr:S-layer homology domain-containing protein [Agathobaculum butyriciproducens]
MRYKRTLSLFLTATTIAVGITPLAGAASVSDYTDYNDNAWYAPAVKYAVDYDIMLGTSKSTLSVERNITRAEFVSLIDRLFATYRQTDISQ